MPTKKRPHKDGDKWFCPGQECQTAFISKQKLQTHLRTSSKHRTHQYKAPCGSLQTLSDNLGKHINRCSECEKQIGLLITPLKGGSPFWPRSNDAQQQRWQAIFELAMERQGSTRQTTPHQMTQQSDPQSLPMPYHLPQCSDEELLTPLGSPSATGWDQPFSSLLSPQQNPHPQPVAPLFPEVGYSDSSLLLFTFSDRHMLDNVKDSRPAFISPQSEYHSLDDQIGIPLDYVTPMLFDQAALDELFDPQTCQKTGDETNSHHALNIPAS